MEDVIPSYLGATSYDGRLKTCSIQTVPRRESTMNLDPSLSFQLFPSHTYI